jgi:hypothetical protein
LLWAREVIFVFGGAGVFLRGLALVKAAMGLELIILAFISCFAGFYGDLLKKLFSLFWTGFVCAFSNRLIPFSTLFSLKPFVSTRNLCRSFLSQVSNWVISFNSASSSMTVGCLKQARAA